MGELDKYNPETQEDPERQLPNDMDALAAFSKLNDNVDFAGRIVWKEQTDKMVKLSGRRYLISENIEDRLSLRC